jgi:hypothetical protein
MAERTSNGVPVTEDMLDEWVREAEDGYPVEELRRRGGRPTIGAGAARVVTMRVDAELLDRVLSRAEREHLNQSEAIRAAMTEWAS